MIEIHLAIVVNGIVTNILVVDPDDQSTIDHFGGLLVPDGSPVAIGWTFDGTNFAAPPKYATPAEAQAAKVMEIEMLERQQLLPRITREALLSMAVVMASAQGVSEEKLYAENIGYQKMKDFDNQIAALRAKL